MSGAERERCAICLHAMNECRAVGACECVGAQPERTRAEEERGKRPGEENATRRRRGESEPETYDPWIHTGNEMCACVVYNLVGVFNVWRAPLAGASC